MSRPSIPARLRLENWQRARGYCEYCGIHEENAVVPHQPDHIIAVQHRGPPIRENLPLACAECNLIKGTNLSSVDPETGEIVLLFNPRQHVWADHFRLQAAHIIGLTPTGRATVALLQFNRADRVRLRKTLFLAGRYSR